MLLAAGPGRMRFRIDIKMQRVARLAPRRAGGEFASVGHNDLDEMVIRMGIGFHIQCLAPAQFALASLNLGGL